MPAPGQYDFPNKWIIKNPITFAKGRRVPMLTNKKYEKPVEMPLSYTGLSDFGIPSVDPLTVYKIK